MNIVELIQKKRDGRALHEEEVAFIIKGYLNDSIPDYQISALLMAIFFRDMDERETVTLTRLMRDSGVVLDFSHLPGPRVDKHSTGGVGDKVSLILAPLMAAAGVYVPMISGRGLGHTGGTLDKLEAIPGFRTQLSLNDFRDLTAKIGTCLIGQTADICPADRRLYALRDVTGTVPAMPLICASILSKKLAEGLNALVLDVKVGGGAIFENAAQAEELALRLIRTARHFNLKTIALLTDMSQPLGNSVGNWLEVLEAVEVLHGRGPEDVKQVTLALGAAMLQAAGKIDEMREGVEQLAILLRNGAALKKFLEIVQAQGGDTAVLEHPAKYPTPRYREQVLSSTRAMLPALIHGSSASPR
jgi:pyrimidine-nucleoside phosphorylase